MWVFLNDSFVSLVVHREQPGMLLMRARKAGDIEALLPQAKVWRDPRADYPFRAEVSAEHAALALAVRANTITYDNFKNSVREHSRHDAYMEIWGVMNRWGHKMTRGGNHGPNIEHTLE